MNRVVVVVCDEVYFTARLSLVIKIPKKHYYAPCVEVAKSDKSCLKRSNGMIFCTMLHYACEYCPCGSGRQNTMHNIEQIPGNA